MKTLLLISFLLVSCGSKTASDELKELKNIEGPDQMIVGRIASVSKRGKFVLIQKLGTGTLPKGVIYQSRGPDGRTASLRPSGERVRDFFAADLLSGETEKGNAVIAYQNRDRKQTTEEDKIDPEDEIEDETKENLDEDGLPENDQAAQTIRD
ncbi:MAG: hypothetical protein P8M04_05470 [Akkermansiaceae bacterium]|nr:hypothetical protein [Akkermansiaceae bacterium]